jgi:hypothetical protein
MPINNKPSWIVLVIILSFSVLAMAIPAFAWADPVRIVTPTPEPTLRPTSTPTPTSNVALDYSEVDRTTEGAYTTLVLAVNSTYNFGGAVTIDFQKFILNIAVERGGPPPVQAGDFIFTGTAKPIENGTATIDSNHAPDFQLTFVFSTLQNNAHGQTPFTNYELVYSGSTSATSSSPTPTPAPTPSPSVPEFPPITLLSVVAVFSLVAAIVFRKSIFKGHSERTGLVKKP